MQNYLADAAVESMPAYHADRLFALLRHARISRERAADFWERVDEVIREFSQLPREGDTVYGLIAGTYPTDHPTLPFGDRGAEQPGGLTSSGP